jgi:tetratricopeptide (TPR) repeat protein
MKYDQISEYIQSPAKLNHETLPLLKELTELFPAFETAWILYLRNLKNLQDQSFENELVKAAIHIQNRRKLYSFLNAKPENQAIEGIEDETVHDNRDELFNLIFAPDYLIEANEKADTETHEGIQTDDKKNLLIDRFLEAQPKMPIIKPGEAVSASASHQTEKDEYDDLVTETLASIYAQQGYYKKAIQIFEKLSLKYPEKSTYFAAQIEKIKILMNN